MYRLITAAMVGVALTYAATAAGMENNLVLDGSLVSEPCTLDPNTTELAVDFKNIVDKDLYSHTRTVGQDFEIDLVDCDPSLGQSVAITFKGQENSSLKGLLETTDGAKGIGIGIETADGNVVAVNKTELTYAIAGKKVPLYFKGFVQGEPDAITNRQIVLGPFSTMATFELSYP